MPQRKGQMEYKVQGPGTPAYHRDACAAFDMGQRLARACARFDKPEVATLTEQATGRTFSVTPETDWRDVERWLKGE